MADDGILLDTTIVAIATPPGRGGIGIVRLSGPRALPIAAALFQEARAFTPRTAQYRLLRDSEGNRIDDALVTSFPAPHSYTGEDVMEIATHGSPVVLDWLVHACVRLGAVPARAGEFTERAFLAGRLDLTGAEAVRDLIEAQTLAQARLAAEQMGGSIAAAVLPGKEALLTLIAGLEAAIDFAEDDVPSMPGGELSERIRALLPPIATLLASFAHGRVLHGGIRLAIVGEPNVGKSSLFNRLLQQERAIVTAAAGTTRDVIAERIALDGYPVELLDTAGLRETEDEAERMGVQRSRQAIAEADAVLVVVDAAAPSMRLDEEAMRLLRGRPVLLVRNKIDLLQPGGRPPQSLPAQQGCFPQEDLNWPVLHTSTVSCEGLPELKQAVLKLVTGGAVNAGSATLTNLRQHKAVDSAHRSLIKAADAAAANTPHEMVLLDLYQALEAQNELTGEVTQDDVLNLIFSTFCIGK